MAITTLSNAIRSVDDAGQQWTNGFESVGKQDQMSFQTRDKSLIWMDDANYINFSTGNFNTVQHRFWINDSSTELNSQIVNYGMNRPALLRDMQDNIILVFWWYNGYSMQMPLYRWVKPAGGWDAWINNSSRPALSSGFLNNSFRWYYAGSDTSTGFASMTGYHVARAANIACGALYIAMSPCGDGYNNNNNSDQVGFTFNLDSGGIVSHGGYDSNQQAYYPYRPNSTSNYMTGNMGRHRGISAVIPFQPHSSQGVRTGWYGAGDGGTFWYGYYQQDAFNERNNNKYRMMFSRWTIDANGAITTAGYNYHSATFWGPLRNVDFEAGSGTVSINAWTATHGPLTYTNNAFNGSTYYTEGDGWYGNSAGRNAIICTIFNGKPTLNTLDGRYDSVSGNWKPQNWTYSTTPTNWVFKARIAPTITWISPTILRMFASNGTSAAYMDITWDGTNFTFPASATSVAGFNASGPPKAPCSTLLNKYFVFTRDDVEMEVSDTPVAAASYNYSSFGSIPEPYVTTLKANNGMKFQYQSSATVNDANVARWGSDANYLPNPWTSFQFKRVSTGGTEYYNYTTNAWTSSVVNNAAALFPSGGGACPPYSSTGYFLNDIQGTWADNTSYTYSYVFTDPNGVTKETSTKTIATPAVSAAPTAPTPRRIFVQTLQNRTSSHVLSVENRILINKINMVNQSANSVGVTLNLGGYNFLSTVTLAPYQTAQFETAVIANPAERLLVTCTADASVDMWIMGTEGV
jgi:hypothetical protein